MTFADDLKRIFRHRPTIEPQVEPADCGFVCASAITALLGERWPVSEIKAAAGHTSRGLTLRQLRDVLSSCGAEAEAIFFDKKRASAFPCPGVVLLERGHYVVIADVDLDRNRIEVFDPAIGWLWVSRRRLARQANGFGVLVSALPGKGRPDEGNQRPLTERVGGKRYLRFFVNRIGIGAILAFAAAQSAALALPILSMKSVDAVVDTAGVGLLGAVGIGFVLVSVVSTATSFLANLLSHKVTRLATGAVGRFVYDAFAAKPYAWFEANRPSTIQNKAASVEARLRFAGDLFRGLGGLLITFVVGMLALFYISPWLAIPGLCSLALAIGIELAFNKAQLANAASSVEATQGRQAFVLDVLSQLPLLARFGTLRQGRFQYVAVVGRAAAYDARSQSLQSWRGLLTGSVKALETLVFVSVAAIFMSKGDYTLGGFVALGAYKDLLAQSMASLFQLRQRNKAMEIHRLQARDLEAEGDHREQAGSAVRVGRLSIENVAFRYGSLDAAVLHEVSFEVEPGECVVIKGPSGAGKTTLAKLIAGVLEPTSGRVLIDGAAPAHPMEGFAAVLQTDRLITGTVRDNITLFRRGVTDTEVYEALAAAELEGFVQSLPMRLNTIIGEGMTGLSGGQRQRLMVARAALKRPRLMLLDEATSSLEVEVESRILKNLIGSGATMIIIAHRPEVWAFASKLVTVAEGRAFMTTARVDGALDRKRRQAPSRVGAP